MEMIKNTCRAFVGLYLLILAAGCGSSGEGEAQGILDATGIKGGIIVHVGCGDARLTTSLRAGDSVMVQGLESD